MTFSATHASDAKLSGLSNSWDEIKAAATSAGFHHWKHAKEIKGGIKYLSNIAAAVSTATESGWTIERETA
ncbi:MAG: hypothetical protein V3S71_02800 [Acidobacteriota bacterium]